MIRTKGEAGTGDIVNAVTHMRAVFGGIRRLQSLREDELYAEAKELRAPVRARPLGRRARPAARRHLHRRRHRHARRRGAVHAARRRRRLRRLGHLQVGRDKPDDYDGWAEDVSRRAKAIVEATTHYADPKILADVSAGLGEPMVGISSASLAESERLEVRGW